MENDEEFSPVPPKPTKMVKLIQDAECNQLFTGSLDIADKYTWIFDSRGRWQQDYWIRDNFHEFVESHTYPGFSSVVISSGHFSSIVDSLALDEWSYLTGFKTEQFEPSIIQKIIDNQSDPHLLQDLIDERSVLWFVYIAERWEAMGDYEVINKILNPNLLSVDSPCSYYFTPNPDVTSYHKASDRLTSMELNQ